MKKLIFLLVSIFLSISIVWAHPLDISNTTLNISKNSVNVTTYFHSYEIEYLLHQNNIYFKSVPDYYQHKDIIIDYLKKNISLSTQNKSCKIGEVNIIEDDEYRVLSNGLEMNYRFECEAIIEKLDVYVNFFTNFPLQTNQFLVYNLNDPTKNILVNSLVFTPTMKNFTFDLNQKEKKCEIDTDGDGLSDNQEARYKTQKNNIDSDGDFYTDYEEIYGSFSPLDKNYGPNQLPRYEIPHDIKEKVKNSIITSKDCKEGISQTFGQNGLLASGFTNQYFTDTLKYISDYVNKNSQTSVWYILGLVVILGAIHAMGPGHSKSLLISYMIDEEKDFFDGVRYITIFTITHLLDIVLLFGVTKIFFSLYDISIYMLYIQRISLVILLFFSIFVFYRAYVNRFSSSVQNMEKKSDIKGSIFLGFVSGLAPCTFGWSIFLLLFSLGSFGLILPMIFALGTGIFICLFLVMTITLIARKNMFSKIKHFSSYSSMVSSGILILLSFYLLFLLF